MGGSRNVKSYVCLRCSYDFRYVRMVEYCPNCGTRGFMQLKVGFNMNKEKAIKLLRTVKHELDCDNIKYHDELAVKLEELEKWIDYKIKI